MYAWYKVVGIPPLELTFPTRSCIKDMVPEWFMIAVTAAVTTLCSLVIHFNNIYGNLLPQNHVFWRFFNGTMRDIQLTIPPLYIALHLPGYLQNAHYYADTITDFIFAVTLMCEVLYEGFDHYIDKMFGWGQHSNVYRGIREILESQVNGGPQRRGRCAQHYFCPKFWHEGDTTESESLEFVRKSYYLDGTAKLSPVFCSCYCTTTTIPTAT